MMDDTTGIQVDIAELSQDEIDALANKILDVYIEAYKRKDGMCDIE